MKKKNDYKKKQVRDKKLNSSSGTWLKIKIIQSKYIAKNLMLF